MPFICDVRAVARDVLVPFHDDIGEQVWRVLVVVWLGAGGPGFQTWVVTVWAQKLFKDAQASPSFITHPQSALPALLQCLLECGRAGQSRFV